jgi:hypothetical protein
VHIVSNYSMYVCDFLGFLDPSSHVRGLKLPP